MAVDQYSSLLGENAKFNSEVSFGPYPVMIEQENGKKVPVVQAFKNGKYLGNLTLTFDQEGNLVNATGQPVLLDDRFQKGKMKKRGACSLYVEYIH